MHIFVMKIPEKPSQMTRAPSRPFQPNNMPTIHRWQTKIRFMRYVDHGIVSVVLHVLVLQVLVLHVVPPYPRLWQVCRFIGVLQVQVLHAFELRHCILVRGIASVGALRASLESSRVLLSGGPSLAIISSISNIITLITTITIIFTTITSIIVSISKVKKSALSYKKKLSCY